MILEDMWLIRSWQNLRVDIDFATCNPSNGDFVFNLQFAKRQVMKTLLLTLLTFSVFCFSCNNTKCDNAPTFEKCSERPTTGTTCQAYWESWFYNFETGKSEKIGYSGCAPIGFETQEESEQCNCYRLE